MLYELNIGEINRINSHQFLYGFVKHTPATVTKTLKLFPLEKLDVGLLKSSKFHFIVDTEFSTIFSTQRLTYVDVLSIKVLCNNLLIEITSTTYDTVTEGDGLVSSAWKICNDYV